MARALVPNPTPPPDIEPVIMPQFTPAILLILLFELAILAWVIVTWLAVILRFAFEQPVLPPRAPRIVPWGAKSVLAAILIWFAMQNLAALAYYAAVKRPRADPATPAPSVKSSLSPVEMMGLSAAGNVATVIVIPLLLAATSGARRRDFGIEGPGMGRQVLRGVVAYPLLAPCVFGLMLVCVAIWGKTPHPLEDAMVKDRSPGTVALLAFAGVVMAPLSEELLFRGVLLGWLTRVALGARSRPKPPTEPDWAAAAGEAPDSSETPVEGSFHDPISVEAVDAYVENPYLPPQASIVAAHPADDRESSGIVRMVVANVAVSAVFAALHGAQWPAPVPLFVLSMGLGFLYQRTGSLIGPIALHMTFNGISTLLMFLSVGVAPTTNPKAPNPIPGPALRRDLGGKIESSGGQAVDSRAIAGMIHPVLRTNDGRRAHSSVG